jgi:hypothetical protein
MEIGADHENLEIDLFSPSLMRTSVVYSFSPP